ncbi:DUF3923 family protein [uncultured Catenibacterium sp.]|uniref:DUF3923 family protein n=2 Tax=uncultured Catenibacterium sp. TaxID=286142 RepID=UPI00345963B3
MVSKRWKTFQIIQFVFFLCVSVFLFTRTVDGHGAVQTSEVKLIRQYEMTRRKQKKVTLLNCSIVDLPLYFE